MPNDNDAAVTSGKPVLDTAYMGEAASTYDALRFRDRHGLAFDRLERDQVMSAAAGLPAGASVLEVGCGTARFAIQLAQQGYRVTASDASPDMLKIAREKAGSLTNITFHLFEGAHVDLPTNGFDFVFAIRVMNSLESTEYALQTAREMIRLASPGGRVLIEFANAERPLAKQNNSVRLSFGQLRALAAEEGCRVERQAGVLLFSQTLLNKMPVAVLPLWVGMERALSAVFWRWVSRGYITLRKERAS